MSNRLRAIAALGAIAALTLTGCSTGSDDAGAEASADTITIEHAFGEAVIPAGVERVVTWGWGSADAAIALGVVPVGIPAQSYGGNSEGVLPWIEEALEAAGAETPEVLPDNGEAPIEAIAALEPDLILAPYSGIKADEYELLSSIAPTVAYPETEWSTPWRDVISITGEALGKEDEAAALLQGIDDQVAEQAAAHPEFEGKTISAVLDSAGTFYVYTPADPRVEFLNDLGFENAPSVEALDTGESTFFFTLSYEQLDQLESDVLVSYSDSTETDEAFKASSQGQTMAQVRDGHVASIVGTSLVSSVSPPTALSLPWGLEDFIAALEQAVPAE